MDIWNNMLKKTIVPNDNLSNLQEYLLSDRPSSFRLNKAIDLASNEHIISFVSQYIKERGLASSYALNRSCFKIIDRSVVLILQSKETSLQDLNETVKRHFESFPETQQIIDEKSLFQEMKDAAEGKKWSGDHLITPPNMSALGQLTHQLQRSIEDGYWEMNEKADAFMCSLTLGDYKDFDYESFIYQLSRGIECEDTINNFIPYLQKEAKYRASRYSGMSKDFMNVLNLDHMIHYYEAEVLRLIQWAKIGNIDDMVQVFCGEMTFRHPIQYSNLDSSKSNFYPLFLSYMTHPYCLLRSDMAINKLYTKLLEYVHQCQDRLCENLGYGKKNDILEYNNISTAAFYLFGAYRLGIDRFDSSVIEQSMSFLQVNQLENGSFLSFEKYGNLSHEVNAIIAHALWISETFGWERSLRRLTNYSS